MRKLYSKILSLGLTLALSLGAYAQNNLAPLAGASASICNTGACSTLNDLNFGTCGSQQMWISTSTPPSSTPGVDWLQFDWASPVSFNSFTIHHAQTGTRFLAGATVQIWNPSTAGWTDIFVFANLPNTNCSNTVVLPATYTSTKLRLTSFTMSGSQLSNPNFREIEIWEGVVLNTPKIAPLANFQPMNNADTLWVGSPSVLVNTSSYADTSYWAITGYNATTPNGTWDPYTNPTDLLQTNNRGTWIDTVKNVTNFYYTFPNPGYYRIKLFTGNKYGNSFVEKAVFVSNPVAKPRAMFFANRRQLAVYDRSQMNDLSTNGPTKWKWWLDPPCYTCGLYKNEFIIDGVKGDTSSSPYLQAAEAGIYNVCLAVSNAIGSDTICQKTYLKVIPGFQMCNGTDSFATTSEGAVMPTINAGAKMQYVANSCAQGFRIAPCADTIILSIDRLRLRNNGSNIAPGDSLYIRTGILPGSQILRRFGGNDLSVVKDSLKTLKFAGQQLWVVYVPVAPQGPSTLINDSGFLIRWSSVSASYAKPKAAFSCPDTIYSGYKVTFQNQSTGNYQGYAWDINNDGVYGRDKTNLGIDSTNQNPSMIYNVTSPTTKTVCLKTFNCVGSDTICKTFTVLPTTILPFADFYAPKTYGLTSDTFQLIDKSFNGANQWKWKFEPNNLTFLGGTDSTSQNPVVFLNTNTSYTITLTASNSFGSSISKKIGYITTISYPSPGSQFTPTSSVEDFGITRVVLNGSIGRIDTLTSLKPNDGSAYTPLFNISKTTVYRGGKYNVDVFRGDNPLDSMNLRVWIDFNRNANYLDDPRETIISEDRKLKVKTSGSFTVPSDASIGSSRMLVGASAGFSTLTPYSATLGVYEEYGVIIGRDIVKPVIKLKGSAITKTEINKNYDDSGAIATDNIEGDISTRIITINEVDNRHVGYYTVKYIVADNYGNLSDTVVRIVQVEVNQSGPTIVMNGPDTVYLEVRKDSYKDLGATAKDNTGIDITGSLVISNNLDTANVGTYFYHYAVADAFGFIVTKKRIIIVKDTEKPVIHTRTINDTDFVIHQIKTPFDENVYIRVDDNYWTNITPMRSANSVIDVDKPGLYYMTYTATDGSGNVSLPRTIAVRVTNIYKPFISLVGAQNVILKVFENYKDPRAVAYDYYNVPLQVDMIKDSLNVNVLGSYYRVYSAIDEYGNEATITRYIEVKDLTAPVISVLGENPITFVAGSKTKEEIAALVGVNSIKVSDNYDPTPTVSDNASIMPFDKPGTYPVNYDAKDKSGNIAQQKQRYVQIIPNTGLAQLNGTQNVIHVYPNPSKGLVNIDLKFGDIKNIKVYNIAGMLVKEINGAKVANTYQVDLSNESEGMYLIRVETSEKVFTSKVNISK